MPELQLCVTRISHHSSVDALGKKRDLSFKHRAQFYTGSSVPAGHLFAPDIFPRLVLMQAPLGIQGEVNP